MGKGNWKRWTSWTLKRWSENEIRSIFLQFSIRIWNSKCSGKITFHWYCFRIRDKYMSSASLIISQLYSFFFLYLYVCICRKKTVNDCCHRLIRLKPYLASFILQFKLVESSDKDNNDVSSKCRWKWWWHWKKTGLREDWGKKRNLRRSYNLSDKIDKLY